MLRKVDSQWYGDNHADIAEELQRYSQCGDYLIHHSADAVCKCTARTFRLELDEAEGAAVRTCIACSLRHPIGDSADYLDEAELEECSCPCGKEDFEIAVGVSLYDDSDDVRWLYIGCRCVDCGLTACYGDWKNEYIGYKNLLALA